MSAPPEPDDQDVPPRPLLGLTFWLLLAFAALCVIAGIAVATLGPGIGAP